MVNVCKAGLYPAIRRLKKVFKSAKQLVPSPLFKYASARLNNTSSVVNNGLALAAHFGDGTMNAQDLAAGIIGAIIKDPIQDKIVWKEYLETVIKGREEWKDIYRACRDLA